MAYGPGVDEINYSDLPPTGDTVNSAFQKTQNQLDTLYTGLNNDIVRASEAEVNAATDTTKLITPGTLLKGNANGVASLDALGKVTGAELPDASETVKGVVELATSAEVLAGVDTERAVTVKDLDYSYATIDSDRIYEGVDLTTKFAAEIAGYTDVWAWIKARITAVNFKGLHIGDYVPFTLGAETIHAQIAGIDTYYRTTDSELGHHIDFISRDCMATLRQWNTTNVNNGSADNSSPYMVSALKSTLDGLVTSLPAGLQSVITTKRFLLESRYSSDSTLTDSTSWAWNDMGKLWVPTEYEVFGNIVMGTKPYAAMQGVQYPIFANSYKSRIKGQGHQGSRYNWWLATVRSGNSAYACSVSSSGIPTNGGAASDSYGVPLCFRIA